MLTPVAAASARRRNTSHQCSAMPHLPVRSRFAGAARCSLDARRLGTNNIVSPSARGFRIIVNHAAPQVRPCAPPRTPPSPARLAAEAGFLNPRLSAAWQHWESQALARELDRRGGSPHRSHAAGARGAVAAVRGAGPVHRRGHRPRPGRPAARGRFDAHGGGRPPSLLPVRRLRVHRLSAAEADRFAHHLRRKRARLPPLPARSRRADHTGARRNRRLERELAGCGQPDRPVVWRRGLRRRRGSGWERERRGGTRGGPRPRGRCRCRCRSAVGGGGDGGPVRRVQRQSRRGRKQRRGRRFAGGPVAQNGPTECVWE
jgi:hypothetical protein